MNLDWINVKDKGAVGNGINDDTSAIQNAINEAFNTHVGVVYLPQGTYKVTSTIFVENYSSIFGVMLIGANPFYSINGSSFTGTKILSTLTGDNPIFSFLGNSGSHGNSGLKNINITANSGGNGVGIYIDGSCFCIFENLRLIGLSKGIWLKNTGGNSAEQNFFNYFRVENCNTFLQFTKGSTDQRAESFHGCSFDNMFITVGGGQQGVVMDKEVVWYNGNFNFHFWTPVDNSTILILANGKCRSLNGNITIEGNCNINGTGYFNFNGYINFLDFNGFINNLSNGKVLTCNNYGGIISLSEENFYPAQSVNNYQWKEYGILYFKNFISGKIVISTGRMLNPYAASASFDVHWHINNPNNFKYNVIQSSAWNGTWAELIDLEYNNTGGYNKFRVKTNNKNEVGLWVFFNGIKF